MSSMSKRRWKRRPEIRSRACARQLADEYRDQPGDRIDEAAKHALDRFGGAKVKEFVPILAWRHARQHLRHAS